MNEFVQQYPESPYVQSMIVSLILNHFGSHVLESTTKGVSLLAMVRLNAPTEIADFYDVTFFYQNIFRFDISVD